MRMILATFLVLIAVAAAAQTTPDPRVQSLVFDAAQKYAESLRTGDLQTRLNLLDQAAALFSRVVEDYPASEAAQRIRAGLPVAGLSADDIAKARREADEFAWARQDTTGETEGDTAGACLANPNPTCLFDLAADIGLEVERLPARNAMLAKIAKARALSGQTDEALRVARTIKAHPTDLATLSIFTDLAVIQAELGDQQGALTNAEAIADRSLSARAFAGIVKVLVARGAFDAAEDLAGRIEDDAYRARAIAVLAAGNSQRGAQPLARKQFDQAVDLALSVGKLVPREAALAKLAGLLSLSGDFSRAATVANWIIDERRRTPVMGRVVRNGFLRGELKAAYRLLWQLRDNRGFPRLVGEIGATLIAAERFGDAVTLVNKLDNEIARGRIMIALLDAPLSAQAAAGLAQAASGLEDPTLKSWALAISARNLAALGEPDTAQALVVEALGLAEVLTPKARGNTVLEAAAAKLSLGQADEAWAMIASLDGGVVWDRGVRGLAAAAAAQGDLTQSIALVESFVDEADRSRMLLSISDASAKRGDIASALQLAEAIELALDRRYAFYGIAKAQAAAGDSPGATATLARAEGLLEDGFLMGDFAATQAAAGDFEAALDSVKIIQLPYPLAQALTAVAVAMAGAKQGNPQARVLGGD